MAITQNTAVGTNTAVVGSDQNVGSFGSQFMKGLTCFEQVQVDGNEEKRLSLKQVAGNALFACGGYFLGAYLRSTKQLNAVQQ